MLRGYVLFTAESLSLTEQLIKIVLLFNNFFNKPEKKYSSTVVVRKEVNNEKERIM